jgi:hypothetical protein
MARSGPGISAIFASTSLSPSALRAAAFSSWTRSFIAARSSSVNFLDVLPIAVVLLAAFCVAFAPGFLSAIVFADLLRAALSRDPDVADRSPASYFSGSPCAGSSCSSCCRRLEISLPQRQTRTDCWRNRARC